MHAQRNQGPARPGDARPAARRSPIRAASRAGRRLAAAGMLAAALPALAIGGPLAAVAYATRAATACFASVEAPRGPALPDCRRALGWFALGSRAPWASWVDDSARRRAEELAVRAAVTTYVDAAVGRPDRGALEGATAAVDAAESAVASGSRRVTFDELGPASGAPGLGREAARIGDRRALLAQPDRWPDWAVRVQTLRAALTEGDLQRAITIADSYAKSEPRDEDLRTTVGALLCMGSSAEAARGVALLTLTQDDRASRRYAGMARNWGDVRAVLVACAARAGVEPPPAPTAGEAGVADAEDVRAAQGVRVAALKVAQDGGASKRAAVEAARALLASTSRAPRDPLACAALLAVVLTEDEQLDAATAARLARPAAVDGAPAREHDAARSSVPFDLRAETDASPLASEWLPERGLKGPVVAGPALARAAGRAAELAGSGALAPAALDALRAAAGVLGLQATRALALAGDAPAAIEALDRFGSLTASLDGAAALMLARSSAWYIAGDRDRALALLDGVDLATATPAVRAAALLQRAELLASHGRRLDAARAAVLADEAAELASPARGTVLGARARWTRLALARAPNATPLRPGASAPNAAQPAPDAATPWPWVGFASLAAPWTRADQAAFSLALAGWSAARDALPAERRAVRYAALRRRGDAPPALAAYADTAAQLLGEGEGDAEVWLDALLAVDAPRFSLRQVAFARAEAARWRGDAASAAAWQRRFDALRAAASDPDRAEIARYLGL